MRLSIHFLLVAAVALGATATAQQKPIAGSHGVSSEGKENPLATEAFRKHVEDLIQQWHVPGFAIGIVDGEDIWTQVWHGMA